MLIEIRTVHRAPPLLVWTAERKSIGCSGRGDGAGRKLQELRIVPELLGSKEVDAVLSKVGGPPCQIEGELHTVLIQFLFVSFRNLQSHAVLPLPLDN